MPQRWLGLHLFIHIFFSISLFVADICAGYKGGSCTSVLKDGYCLMHDHGDVYCVKNGAVDSYDACNVIIFFYVNVFLIESRYVM